MARSAKKRRPLWWRIGRVVAAVAVLAICCVALLLVALGVYLNGTPVLADHDQIESATSPANDAEIGGGLDGFESPYLGHTGSWDGKGGAMFGGSKTGALDKEVNMGLRWTFMCVYWREMEPKGPVTDLSDLPKAWRQLDEFVIAAHQRKLNILMQAPVVGGNAGGPPKWAGRREKGKSAPSDMQDLADFAGRLAERYAPGGTLARQQGWADTYGVRAWELDNEPESYRTNWGGQAGDYAEFVAAAAAKIRAHDPQAFLLAPGCAGGGHAQEWIAETLDAHGQHGSPTYKDSGAKHSIGPHINGVSFHVYEGLDTFLAGKPRTIERVFGEQKRLFDKWAAKSAGFEFDPPTQYWHTEGNYDFLGVTSSKRRAAWRWQFFSRAFAAGVSKVCVMDTSKDEQVAVRQYVKYLPQPHPMQSGKQRARTLAGEATIFVHDDPVGSENKGRVWIAWAKPGSDGAEVEIPARNNTVRIVDTTGRDEPRGVKGGAVRLRLESDKSISPPQMVVDRP